MTYGRELNTPLSLLVQDGKHFKPTEVDQTGREVYELHKKIKTIIRKVQENAEIDFMYAKRYHDRNIHGPFFKEGDYCYVLIQCPSHKFSHRWRGPLRVNKVINDHLYVIQITPEKEKVVNISKMKHYDLNKYSEKGIRNVKAPEKHFSTDSTLKKHPKTMTSDDESDDEMVIFYPVKKPPRKPRILESFRGQDQDTPPPADPTKSVTSQPRVNFTPERRESYEPAGHSDRSNDSPREGERSFEGTENEVRVDDQIESRLENEIGDELDREIVEEQEQQVQREPDRGARPGLRDKSLLKQPDFYGISTIIENDNESCQKRRSSWPNLFGKLFMKQNKKKK